MTNIYDAPYGCCDPPVAVENQSYSIPQKICKLISDVKDLSEKIDEAMVDIDEKEDSVNITNGRKLSEDGDFTGSLCNKKTACQIPDEIDNNRDQIQYLVNQFSDGQTGLVIDGGFFVETGIEKNYDGGVF